MYMAFPHAAQHKSRSGVGNGALDAEWFAAGPLQQRQPGPENRSSSTIISRVHAAWQNGQVGVSCMSEFSW